MKIPDFKKSYEHQTRDLMSKHGIDKAMSLAVGGDFEAVGKLEFALLRKYGLTPHDMVIDVGCGSGRLAIQLVDFLESEKYVGLDVVETLVDYARTLVQRDDWRFYVGPGLTIPEGDGSADFICFFSVFTHLLHEETFKYLKDSARVLRNGGKIIFSFLEFRIPSHWSIFQGVLNDERIEKVLNQFMSRDMIEAFAEHCGLEIVEIHDGDFPYIEINEIIIWDNGMEMSGFGTLGQSVCVLQKI